MKKSRLLLTSALLSCGFLNSFGQTEKGKFLVSASSSFDFTSLSSKWETDSNSGDAGKTTGFDLAPSAGYFLGNNLAVGLQLSLNRVTEKDDADKYTETTTMLMPFALLYFGKSNVKPFIQAGFGPGWYKAEYSDSQSKKLSAYELGGGIAIFINQHVSLDISLGYASVSSKFTDGWNVNWKTVSKGIGGNIGFSIIP